MNTNQKMQKAYMSILSNGSFDRVQSNAFKAAHVIASVRAFNQADGYLKSLLRGKVHRSLRREFIDASREAVEMAAYFRKAQR